MPSNVEALFALAPANPAVERGDWLDRECNDKALRARLESLLAAHDQPESSLATLILLVFICLMLSGASPGRMCDPSGLRQAYWPVISA